MGVVREIVQKEVMPCVSMVAMEFCTILLTIMCSMVMAKGMSPFVFVVYTNALSSIFLLIPCSFKTNKDRQMDEEPFFTIPLLAHFSLLGLTGVTMVKNFAFVGLSYSSPILACGMGNLIPTFSFLLSNVVPRGIRFDWGYSSSRVKTLGSLLSIIGALSITLYKGPVISSEKYSYLSSNTHLLRVPPQHHFISSSRHENWVLGGTLLATASLVFSIWNIIQAGTVEQFPYVEKVITAYTIIGTIQTTIVSVIVERNIDTWRVKLDMELLVILLYAIFGSVIRNRVQIWCMKVKGPLYVSFFKPIGIPIATIFGCLLFADNFHYGSILGAALVGIGYYTMMWGQLTEHEPHKNRNSIHYDSSENEAPLIEAESQV